MYSYTHKILNYNLYLLFKWMTARQNDINTINNLSLSSRFAQKTIEITVKHQNIEASHN